MPRHRQPRLLAIFGLALAVLAALPCSLLAETDACCEAASGCGDARESPCAQLAATPCCESSGAPLEVTVAARLPVSHCNLELTWPGADRELAVLAAHHAPPASRVTDFSQRTVILRL